MCGLCSFMSKIGRMLMLPIFSSLAMLLWICFSWSIRNIGEIMLLGLLSVSKLMECRLIAAIYKYHALP